MDFPNEHDVEISEKLIAKLDALKQKVARLVHDELTGIVDFKTMLAEFPKVAEALDGLTYDERKQAEAVIEIYEARDSQNHQRLESTYYAGRA